MNTFQFVQCSKNDVGVRSMFDSRWNGVRPINKNNVPYFTWLHVQNGCFSYLALALILKRPAIVCRPGNYVLRRGHFHQKGFLSFNWLVQSRLILSTRNPFYLHCWRWSQKSFVTLSKFLVCHRTLPTDFLAQIQIGTHTRVPSSVRLSLRRRHWCFAMHEF